MIQINRIEPFRCRAYDPYGNHLGMLNDFEFNDLRIQIKKAGIRGYYMRYQNHNIDIDQNGNCSDWPKGFYDLFGDQLMELL